MFEKGKQKLCLNYHLIFAFCTLCTQTISRPTMLWVNVEMFCVELSGKRRSRRPSLGGEVTANSTEWFRLISLTSLVTP